MSWQVRKWVSFCEEVHHDGGPVATTPLRKGAVGVVIENPYAGNWSEDLSELIDPSYEMGTALVARCAELVGGSPLSCGKAALIGTAGDQDHGVACMTTPFGEAIREGIGGNTWVPSNTKVVGPGATVDIPLAYANALFVREFYDTVTVAVADAPRPNEILVLVAMASRGRVHHRVGGLTMAEATVGDGLR